MKTESILSFVLGAVIGGIVAYICGEQKKAKEEMNAMKEEFDKKPYTNSQLIDDMVNNGATKDEIGTVAMFIQRYSDTDFLCEEAAEDVSEEDEEPDEDIEDYIRELRYGESEDKVDEKKNSEPYEIEFEQFGDQDLHTTLRYYMDGVLTDEMDMIMDNEEAMESVGDFWLDKIEHVDAVYIRNDARHCDYEIISEPGNYSDTHGE